ncbi:FAD-dependent monooxygenase [Janibacter terrae]|uniref:FAD-dependent monooxygenase n=1 Tax=Janibacter terrae TaxID=103817 RepID=UPI000835D94B|nr:FAD-dependent monooxygenase [Janibacter terrae]
MSLSVACIGGGPGGLFAATLIKQRRPDARVTVYERNRADDTYGFGVVFSDATLKKINDADPVLIDALREHGTHWEDLEVRLKGERITVGGNGMAAISRKTLLLLLQERARAEGADLRFETEVDVDDVLADHDLVVASDGANSRARERCADTFRPTAVEASAKFIWFGTSYMFDGLTFVHKEGPHGVFAVHGYPISEDVSTFIVETDEETWRRAGLDKFDVTQPPGPSDEKSRKYLEELFADEIDGQPLLVNNSRWGNFRTRRAASWHAGRLALLGDSAHTAHFSVGSGTKMAMEDAIELALAVAEHDDVEQALAAYEAAARPSVEKIQGSAQPSLSWWEHFGRYHAAFDPTQFAFHFMSRSIGRAKIARRGPDFIAAVDAAWRERHGNDPLSTPLDLGEVTFPGRTVRIVERDGRRFVTDDGGAAVPLAECPTALDGGRAVEGGSAPGKDEPWALWLTAPETEDGVTGAAAAVAACRAERPALVAVHGGTPLTRVLLAEEVRLAAGLPVALVEEQADEDRAATLVLSGRADLVATAGGTGV